MLYVGWIVNCKTFHWNSRRFYLMALVKLVRFMKFSFSYSFLRTNKRTNDLNLTLYSFYIFILYHCAAFSTRHPFVLRKYRSHHIFNINIVLALFVVQSIWIGVEMNFHFLYFIFRSTLKQLNNSKTLVRHSVWFLVDWIQLYCESDYTDYSFSFECKR